MECVKSVEFLISQRREDAKYFLKVCHFDGGEISARNSTKIGEILWGATCGDFSSVEMTKTAFSNSDNEKKT